MLVSGRAEGGDFIESPASVPLEIAERGPNGILTFSGQYEVSQNGLYSYGIRVAPYHKNLASKYDLGLMLWG
jgi:phosphorylase/glycogen(starch) synthase